MSFSPAAFFVKRWQFTLLVFTLLALLGINAAINIPRSEDPHFPIPILLIRAVLPGATPVEMEQLIAKPIEDAVDGLDSVKAVSSTNSDGVSVIKAEFTWDTDPERKYDEVVREVNALRPTLPQGVARIDVQRARTSEAAVFEVALTSPDLPMRQLEKQARRLRDRLNRVPGVREAKIWGAPESEVLVEADIGRMAQLHLPLTSLSDALRAAGVESPIGAIQADARRFNVKSGGAFDDPQQIGDVVVTSTATEVVHVRDIAHVAWGQDEPQHITRFNGRRALLVTATQKENADVTRITTEVRMAMDEFERTLPGDVRLERAFFQANNVNHRLHSLYRDFTLAVALVLLTLLPLGLRAGIVVMISIPLSLLIGMSLLEALGFSLNQLSIAGFVLALGLLVDDSIVVIENIARRLREGEDRTQAAIAGTREIALAVLGCTACLMLAFLPLLALGESSGAYIKSLPAAVLVTIGASLLVSMTIIPFLASRMLDRHAEPEGNRLLQLIMRGIHGVYGPLLMRALGAPRRTLGAIFGLCLLAVPMLMAIGTSLFPPADTPQFLIRIEMPDGTALARTGQTLQRVEQRLAMVPQVDWYVGNLGRGNPQIFYNQPQRETSSAYAEVYVSLKAWEGEASRHLLDQLRHEFVTYAGAKITVVAFENGPPIDAPVALRVSGESIETLKRLAGQMEQVLRETPGARDVFNPLRVDRTDLNLGIDADRAAALGVPAGAARRSVQIALSGEPVARLRDADGDDYGVRVRLAQSHDGFGMRNNLPALDEIYVPARDGGFVPLAAIATPQLQRSVARVDRYNRIRSVTVTAYVQSGALTPQVTQAAVARLQREMQLPPGYKLTLGGEAEVQSASFANLGAAIVVAVLGTLAVLVLEFGRMRTALVVGGILPLGLFGAVTSLWLTGNSLSFTANIGIIALVGIEIKNSILLVDFTEQLRAQGLDLMHAVERAGEIRFLPVLLTSATAIGGLLPLALGGSGLYSPLAIVIIGGLVASTVLSRIATPAMYLLLAEPDAKAAQP